MRVYLIWNHNNLVYVITAMEIQIMTLCRQEVGQYDQWRDEGTRQDDINDVEEGLPLDDQIERDLLIFQVIGGVAFVDHLPGRTMHNGPLTILWTMKT